MFLTELEQKILTGKCGEGQRVAMEIMVRMGEVLNAERLVDISSAHITMPELNVDDVYLQVTQKMAEYGCKVKVPTTNNPSFTDYERPGLGSPEMVSPEHPMLAAFNRLGVINTFTCTPFFSGHLPRCGEYVAWAEGTAVRFVNSVLGARTNPVPAMLELMCAILGKAPYYGLYLDENRKGQVLINVKLDRDSLTDLDYALLGFYTNEMAGERIPVIEGLPRTTTAEHLSGIGTIPSYIYHIVGVTPEASSQEQAFGGRRPEQVFEFGPKEYKATLGKYAATEDSDVDIIIVGCPHCSLRKVFDYARALEGKKISENLEFLILTSPAVRQLARQSGYFETIERSGAKLANLCSLFTVSGEKRFKKVLTNSPIYRRYGPGKPLLVSAEDCIQAALTGKFTARS